MRRCIGLMSGTSLDGVDGVLAEVDEADIRVLVHAHRPFPSALRDELLALNQPAGVDELHRAALAANGVADTYAELVAQLPAGAEVIGAHGQTVRHRPELGYTLQLLNASRLAERSGVAVVADLRSRDVASGGQGAPLVPAFHRAVFGRSDQDIAVLNLGGIANLSLLAADGGTTGFDTGPGNALLDYWCERHTGQAYDDAGAWGGQGQLIAGLLQRLLAEPFLQQAAPKSTGRDLFNPSWLRPMLDPAWRPVDVQATLCEFSAATVADALQRVMPNARELIVCGGGAYNADLLQRLQRRLPGLGLVNSSERGLPPLQVEAAAFAWLAARFLDGQPGNLPAVTGARGPRVLGALYPA
ncbi:MAG: anhydro-N-acetylmuramic acid kinase [Inhella sp.]